MSSLTVKQTRFCELYMQLGTATGAYRQAYDAEGMQPQTVHVKACELLKNGKIMVRIAELQREAKALHQLTVEDLLLELEEARQAALAADTPQSSAAVAATAWKARLLGLDKHKVEITAFPDIESRKQFYIERLEKIAFTLGQPVQT